MSRRTLPAAALAAALALALTGCGDTDPLPEAGTDYTLPVAGEPSPEPDSDNSDDAGDQTDDGSTQQVGLMDEDDPYIPNTTSHIPAGSTEVIENPGHNPTRVVTGIHTASHEGFDRIVIDLADDPNPGWFAQFVEEALQPGSGFPIFEVGTVEGMYLLELNLTGMIWPDDPDAPSTPVFTGPALLGGPVGVVQGISLGSWLEGQVQIVVVIDAPTQPEVTITALDGPARVVVDIIH